MQFIEWAGQRSLSVRHAIPLLLIILFFTAPARAERLWTPEDGVLIRHQHHLDLGPSPVASQNGQTLVTWCSTEQFGYDVYGQVIDGGGTPIWPNATVLAGGEMANLTPTAAEDGDGNWLIAFAYGIEIRAQKVSADGDLLWQEPGDDPQEGAVVCVIDDEATKVAPVAVLPDGSGGAYVLLGYRISPNQTYILMLQRMGATGTVHPDWPASGVVVRNHPADDYRMHVNIVNRGNDGVWVVFEESAGVTTYNVVLQGFTGSGDPVFAESYVFRDDVLGNELGETLPLAGDCAGGCYLTWYNEDINRVVVQRFDMQGQPMWADGGDAVRDAPYATNPLVLATLSDETVIVGWLQQGSQPDGDTLFVQRISGADSLVRHWDDDGVPVAVTEPQRYFQALYEAILFADNSIGMVYSSSRYHYPEVLYAARLSSDGLVLSTADLGEHDLHSYVYQVRSPHNWNGACTEQGMLTHVQRTVDGDGLTELRAIRYDVPNQTFPFGDDGMAIRARYTASATPVHLSTWQNTVRTIYSERNHLDSLNVELKRLDRSNGAEIGDSVRIFSPQLTFYRGEYTRHYLKTVADESGYLTVAAADPDSIYFFGQPDNVRLQRISPSGDLIWGAAGVTVGQRSGYGLELADAGDGAVIAAWPYDTGDTQGARVVKVGPDGSVAGTTDIQADNCFRVDDLVQVADGQWMFTHDFGDVYPDRQWSIVSIDEDGAVLWSEDVLDLMGTSGITLVPVGGGAFELLHDDNGTFLDFITAGGEHPWPALQPVQGYSSSTRFLTTGYDASFGWLVWAVQQQIVVQQIDTAGAYQFIQPKIIGGPFYGTLKTVLNPEGDLWLVSGTSGGLFDNSDIGYVHLERDGSFYTGYEDGYQILTAASGEQDLALAAMDGDGGFVATWLDDRGSPDYASRGHMYGQRVAGEVSSVGDGVSDQAVLERFELSRIYPNPFNPAAALTIHLPAPGWVTVTVHDLLGREVATLFNERRIAGVHSIRIDGSRWASGLYFVRAELEGGPVRVRKALLVK